MKLGWECAEKANGLASLLLLLLPAPNWKGAVGWLFTPEFEPNPNVFLVGGSSAEVAPVTACAPKGLLAFADPPKAAGAAPKAGATLAVVAPVGVPKAGTVD